MKLADLLDLGREAIGLVGAGAVTYGAWEVYHPLGPIVGGILAMAAAWLLASRMEPE